MGLYCTNCQEQNCLEEKSVVLQTSIKAYVDRIERSPGNLRNRGSFLIDSEKQSSNKDGRKYKQNGTEKEDTLLSRVVYKCSF